MLKKELRRIRRHGKIRKKLQGTALRPRLSIHRSLNHLYVQVIDDGQSHTLYSFSTKDKDFVGSNPGQGKVNRAKKLGEFYSNRLKEKGIEKIAFDRGGYQFHGRIKALAESLREGGIQF